MGKGRLQDMRILIIRHGEPDYSIDSLTEKGWWEAELLSERLTKMEIKDFYVSPLGRAKATASATLKKMNRTAEECQWLQEFIPSITRPDAGGESSICWDWLPTDWTKEEEFYRKDLWTEHEIMKNGNIKDAYQDVVNNLDKVLEKHGYVREGNIYRVEQPNRGTIVFFCHFGVGCVILSHLLHISPMVLWHHISIAPSSVTTLYTEEREKGIALFRAQSIGDLSHLYAGGEEPSFMARFCEIYDCDERH